MIMNRLFLDGEVAILQSTEIPEYWGAEVTITSGKFCKNPRDKNGNIYPSTFVYTLAEMEGNYAQSCLKKRQERGTGGYDEFMESLKNQDVKSR